MEGIFWKIIEMITHTVGKNKLAMNLLRQIVYVTIQCWKTLGSVNLPECLLEIFCVLM